MNHQKAKIERERRHILGKRINEFLRTSLLAGWQTVKSRDTHWNRSHAWPNVWLDHAISQTVNVISRVSIPGDILMSILFIVPYIPYIYITYISHIYIYTIYHIFTIFGGISIHSPAIFNPSPRDPLTGLGHCVSTVSACAERLAAEKPATVAAVTCTAGASAKPHLWWSPRDRRGGDTTGVLVDYP